MKLFFLKNKVTLPEWELDIVLIIAIFVGAIAGMYAVLIGIFGDINAAGDVNEVWDFATPGEYNVSDANQIEVTGTGARLKVRNYTSDANTKLLLHLDESSGNPTDSSSHGHTTAQTGLAYTTGSLNNAGDFDGTTSKIQIADSEALSLTQSNTIEAWAKFDSGFSAGATQGPQTIVNKGSYKLYFDNETGKVTYELANANSTLWTQQAGYDMLANNAAKVNRSWGQNGKQNVFASVKMGSNIYVGLGGSTNDAEVWEYNTSSGLWTQIAGSGINSSWNNEISTNAYEAVLSLATNGTDVLYAGLGTGTNDGDVWRFKSGSWAKIGGDGLNSGWAGNAFNGVYSLAVSGTTLWAGLGTGGNMGQVWVCTNCETSPNWNGSRLGGFSGTARGWSSGFEVAYSLAIIGTNPIVGLGSGAGDGEVWHCTASCTTPGSATWTKRGGDGTGAGGQSWGSAEYVLSLTSNGNTVFVGTGITANADANVWSCDTSATCSDTAGWTQIGNATHFGIDKEGIYSIRNNGGTLYVGTGSSANGDDEVYRYDGSWNRVGGDNQAGTNTWNATHNSIRTLVVDDTTVYAGLTNTTEGHFWKCTSCDNTPNWGSSRIGGKYVNKSWGQYNIDSVESSATVGGKLYIGTGMNTAGDATVWEQDPNTGYWSIVGGQGVNGSWGIDTHESVVYMVNYKNKLYVGLGVTTSQDAEVWRFDNPGWTIVGGDGAGWSTNIETVSSLAVANDKLYAGTGNNGSGDADVWECTGCDGVSPSWTQIGGTASGNWGATPFRNVTSMVVHKETLYVGIGNSTNQARVYRYSGSGTNWTQVGGSGLYSSWNTIYEDIPDLAIWNDKLVAGLGSTGGGAPNNDAEVWLCDDCNGTPSWTKIAGDSDGADNQGWLDANNYEWVGALGVYNGDLYAGLGASAGDAEVWKYDGSSWMHIGGDGINESWLDSTVEEIKSMTVHKGKLYVGTGNTANSDAMVWSYGNNGYVQSSTNTHNTDWHHVAARYDGTTMELFIDGSNVGSTAKTLTIPDNTQELFIGLSKGISSSGTGQYYFDGMLDEIRISNIARSSFTTSPYATTAQTVSPTTAVFMEDIKNWEDFNETLPGSPEGTITYRLSANSGSTWYYWDGDSWEISASTLQSNDAATVTNAIDSFNASGGGIMWQAVLSGNGSEQTELTSVEITATSDTDDPSEPTTLTALSGAGGTSITTNTWYPHPSPQFTWPTAETIGGSTDSGGSGIAGYYVYFGTDSNATPETAYTIFQTGTTFTPSNLVSGATYHLRIQAKDNAQNVSTVWYPFIYKYDASAPTNPDGLSVSPSGYSGTNEFTFFWSTAGSDVGSQVAGYQYKTGALTGTFSDWSDTITDTSITLSDVAYQENANLFFLRTVDNAGNVSASTIQVSFYYAGEAPTAPRNLSVSPTGISQENAFSFTWEPPETFSGTQNEIRYCYTINTLPSSATCTFTAPGVTSLPIDAYANQPQENILYLVARDNVGNINYGAKAEVVFTVDTPAPGLPLNVEIADVSVKTTESWKLALSWEPPSNDENVAKYEVYVSTDNSEYELASSTNGIAYIGTNLEQTTHYYKVRACDNANNCGADTQPVSLYPDGRYTEPALLVTEPSVTEITTRKATISWTTDRDSDTRIQYGLASNDYFEEEPSNSTQTKVHTLTLNNLTPGTRYFVVAKWTDEDGNAGASDELTFETNPAPTVKSVSVPNTTLSSALVQFTSINAKGATIRYGKGIALSTEKEVETSILESTYTVVLDNLEDGTQYSYRIDPIDSDDFEYEGTILEFSTIPRPRITNVTMQEVRGTAQPSMLISWETNVETTSVLTYHPSGNATATLDQVNLTRTKGGHEQLITALLPNTAYTLLVKGIDQYGNEASSDPQSFTTSTDTRAPRTINLKVDSTIQQLPNNQTPLAQIIITWETDELSTSQIEYGEGTGTTYAQKTQKDESLTTNHSVTISNLTPSKVYHVRTVSEDSAGNAGYSIDTVAITPKATANALDLVISNLQQVFKFLQR